MNKVMSEKNGENNGGVLQKYFEDSDLVEFEGEEPVSNFEYQEPEEREPKGFFDYVLQVFVDFGSEEMGGEDVLELRTDRDAFDSYRKIQKLNTSLIKESIMKVYGFDFEDKYRSSGFNSGNSQFGNSLSQLMDEIDYNGKISTHNGLEYNEGLTEEQVNSAIESVFQE